MAAVNDAWQLARLHKANGTIIFTTRNIFLTAGIFILFNGLK
jgi:hypothetical protein